MASTISLVVLALAMLVTGDKAMDAAETEGRNTAPEGAIWIRPTGRAEEYFVVRDKVDRWQAESLCETYGSHLAEFDTDDEFWAFVAHLFDVTPIPPRDYIFLGGMRSSNKLLYFWERSRETITLNDKWGQGQPNWYDGEYFVVLSATEARLHDESLWSNFVLGYACELLPAV